MQELALSANGNGVICKSGLRARQNDSSVAWINEDCFWSSVAFISTFL
jgi:hypothetical protein